MSSPTQEELDLILSELGDDEVTKRAAELDGYSRYDTLASPYDVTMTPALMVKWAAFAEQLAKEIGRRVIIGEHGNIQADKSDADKASQVARNEFYKRARA